MQGVRRQRRTPLSLFAFQDIITSVTAIMILLVLILTLEFVTRAQWRGVATEDRRVARDLRETVAALQSRANDLRAEQEKAGKKARRAAGLSLAEIRSRLAEAERAVQLLSGENAALAARVRAARVEQRTAERQVVDAKATTAAVMAIHAAAMDTRAAELEEANRRERHRQDQSRRADETHADTTLVFNRDPDNSRSPILVEVAADGITVLAGQSCDRQQFAWGAGRPSADFRSWVTGLNAETEYVVIMLRASGINYLETVRDTVASAGLGLGLELIGESMRVVLPDAGGECL